MSAALALQQGVFATMTGDAGVIALLGSPPRVYDDVPRSVTLPYAVIGDANESNWSTKTDTGASLLFTVRIWSRASGYQEAKLIAGAVRAALDGAALALSGATLIDLSFDSASYARESDGMTRRAELKFRALIEF